MKRGESSIAGRFWGLIQTVFGKYGWVIVGVLSIVAYVFGYVGTIKQAQATGDSWSGWDPFYRPFQLFLMDDSMVVLEPVQAWELEVARFLAPAVSLYTAVLAVLAAFREQWRVFQLRLGSGHVVVCGLGENGYVLVRDFLRRGFRVAVIDSDTGNDWLNACREQGVVVIEGDATDESLLAKVQVQRASSVVALTGDDGANLEIAIHTYTLVKELGRSRFLKRQGIPVRCFPQIVDIRLGPLLVKHPLFIDVLDDFEIRVFNFYENAARYLLESFPLDGKGIRATDKAEVHFVIFGLGKLGEFVVHQVAQMGHFANGKQVRITVVDREIEGKRRGLLARYPSIEDACQLAYVGGDPEDPKVLEQISAWTREEDCLTTIAVAFDHDSVSVTSALGLLARVENPEVTILARATDDVGLALLLGREGREEGPFDQIHTFGTRDRLCTCEMLFDEPLDRIAKEIHEAYCELAREEGRSPGDPSLESWDLCHPDLKRSNRMQADHIPIKLRAIGCRLCANGEAPETVTQFASDEIDILAKMEHERWVSERLIAGWKPGEKDIQKKTSPYLVPWDELDEKTQQYDRNTVIKIPSFVASAGKEIVRSSLSAGSSGE